MCDWSAETISLEELIPMKFIKGKEKK